MTTYNKYTPDFKCTTDGNGKGLLNTSVGLLTYDEVVHAGGYYGQSNSNYYLYNSAGWWTMSPIGFLNGSNLFSWHVGSENFINVANVAYAPSAIRPVLVLKDDTLVMGDGTSSDPFVVQ